MVDRVVPKAFSDASYDPALARMIAHVVIMKANSWMSCDSLGVPILYAIAWSAQVLQVFPAQPTEFVTSWHRDISEPA
ncbi:MAG TPA: hypothetical protein VI457_09440 [Methylococcaceae bacterium]|nr:hypothetical protein [Methylococcaceae bacterium]